MEMQNLRLFMHKRKTAGYRSRHTRCFAIARQRQNVPKAKRSAAGMPCYMLKACSLRFFKRNKDVELEI